MKTDKQKYKELKEERDYYKERAKTKGERYVHVKLWRNIFGWSLLGVVCFYLISPALTGGVDEDEMCNRFFQARENKPLLESESNYNIDKTCSTTYFETYWITYRFPLTPIELKQMNADNLDIIQMIGIFGGVGAIVAVLVMKDE